MTARSWIAPAVVLLSTSGMLAAVAAGASSPMRTSLVVWFLILCPGLAVVGALRLADPWLEVATATALSLAIDVLVTASLSYAGLWSPAVALAILAAVSVGGALAQLGRAARMSGGSVAA